MEFNNETTTKDLRDIQAFYCGRFDSVFLGIQDKEDMLPEKWKTARFYVASFSGRHCNNAAQFIDYEKAWDLFDEVKADIRKTDKCPHENVTFIGMYSLVGHYYCDDCGAKIDPQAYQAEESWKE